MKTHNQIQVICLETDAFYSLIDNVVERIKKEQGVGEDKWISDIQAMQLLQMKSKTTLQKMRDEGRIRFSQPMKKVILYDRESIMDYIERNANETF